jgi:hypothetical protein
MKRREKPESEQLSRKYNWFICTCGCNRGRYGKPNSIYYEDNCRVRDFYRRKRTKRTRKIQEKDYYLKEIKTILRLYPGFKGELAKSHLT